MLHLNLPSLNRNWTAPSDFCLLGWFAKKKQSKIIASAGKSRFCAELYCKNNASGGGKMPPDSRGELEAITVLEEIQVGSCVGLELQNKV